MSGDDARARISIRRSVHGLVVGVLLCASANGRAFAGEAGDERRDVRPQPSVIEDNRRDGANGDGEQRVSLGRAPLILRRQIGEQRTAKARVPRRLASVREARAAPSARPRPAVEATRRAAFTADKGN